MNLKILTAFLAVSLSSSCVIVSNNNNPKPGDVTFTWTFAGYNCSQVPAVSSVVITIPGETLQNNGVYPCLANNYPGIELHNFAPKTYSFTITAYGYGNEALYTKTGTFAVNGNIAVTVDLDPVGTLPSAYLTWQFPANSVSNNPNCSQAGVTLVDVSIDGAQPTRFDCLDGTTSPGVIVNNLSAGSHTISMTAMDNSEYVFYRYAGSLTTYSGTSVSADYTFLWGVGGYAIDYTLSNNTGSVTYSSCAQAGVSNLNINFEDQYGNWVYGNAGDDQSCNDAPVIYNYLQPGNYYVYAQGTGTGGTYTSNTQNPPMITITAGTFVNENTMTPGVTLLMYHQ
jgi:hypothetical protein